MVRIRTCVVSKRRVLEVLKALNARIIRVQAVENRGR